MLAFFRASSADPSGRPFVPDLVGLLQRISIIAGLMWIATLAVRCLREAGVAQSATADRAPGT